MTAYMLQKFYDANLDLYKRVIFYQEIKLRWSIHIKPVRLPSQSTFSLIFLHVLSVGKTSTISGVVSLYYTILCHTYEVDIWTL